ncbi:hypothetical protein ACJIZ3_012850 [Penstemon smallii]|uniref:CRAL-TRIO domain-containing protein n=1 Tax=Penstemon smallii TaxID=265156 RepID=A0ABD3USB2_9LAMI
MAVVPQESIQQFEALIDEEERFRFVLIFFLFQNFFILPDLLLTQSHIMLQFLAAGAGSWCNCNFVLTDITINIFRRFGKNIHQGYPHETLTRFLKAREGNVPKAHKMLLDCLKWRVQNGIDEILAKPIVPVELYRAIRDSQLIGLSGYTYEGLPIFAVGAGMTTFDKASVHYYIQSHIQINEYRDHVVLVSILPAATKKFGKHVSKSIKVLDMTGLKLSALNQIKLMTIISSIDDLNYPEKTLTYYIVNAPYVFSACWKVVKPLLQERTRRKINVLSGCGQEDLLKVMDYSSLPHFCRKKTSGSSKHLDSYVENCFSLDHPFHQQLYNHIKQQALVHVPIDPIKQGSVHVTLPEDADEEVIAKTLESELKKFKDLDRCSESFKNLKVNDSALFDAISGVLLPLQSWQPPPFLPSLKHSRFLILLKRRFMMLPLHFFQLQFKWIQRTSDRFFFSNYLLKCFFITLKLAEYVLLLRKQLLSKSGYASPAQLLHCVVQLLLLETQPFWPLKLHRDPVLDSKALVYEEQVLLQWPSSVALTNSCFDSLSLWRDLIWERQHHQINLRQLSRIEKVLGCQFLRYLLLLEIPRVILGHSATMF